MNQPVYILFTMDVEPTSGRAGVSGPASDAEGAAAIRQYQAVLAAAGYQPTYFVHPEVALSQGALLRDCQAAGACLGLHLHTAKYAASPRPVELGGLTAAEQEAVLRLAMADYERGLGQPARLFRPGCFSANDATFGVLVKLGFEGGGVSIPGRVWPERFCVWSGAPPGVHRPHAAFRQAAGDLPFVDIPLSVDLDGPLLAHPVGFHHHPDLRPGGVYSHTDEAPRDHRALLAAIVARVARADAWPKVLVVDVHNDRDFVSPASPAARHLRTLLDALAPTLAAHGCHPLPATYATVVAACRAAWGLG